jgi:CO/xanthine dehydrogenase FAD-binding subunit
MNSTYTLAHSLGEALSLLAGGPRTVLAGGTDLYPATRSQALPGDILDLNSIGSLRGISWTDDSLHIGALTTWRDIIDAKLPPWLHALTMAAREVGGKQIQNVATVGGNLCNASPAADGTAALLALNASVQLQRVGEVRDLAVGDFVLGNRSTVIRPDELLCAINIPLPSTNAKSTFLKLGARRYLVISIVMVAAMIEADESGTVVNATLCVGACSARASRLLGAEAALVGNKIGDDLPHCIQPEHFNELSPIDDVRADATYRRECALTLSQRAIMDLSSKFERHND